MVPEPSRPRVITELIPIQEFKSRTKIIAGGKKYLVGFMDVP
jgi:hypothetical protein